MANWIWSSTRKISFIWILLAEVSKDMTLEGSVFCIFHMLSFLRCERTQFEVEWWCSWIWIFFIGWICLWVWYPISGLGMRIQHQLKNQTFSYGVKKWGRLIWVYQISGPHNRSLLRRMWPFFWVKIQVVFLKNPNQTFFFSFSNRR